VLPLQQPPAHDDALQTHWPVLLSQVCPVAHPAHVAPAVPHEVLDSDAYPSHVPLVPPLQHPAAQVLASHEQEPLVRSQRPLAHEPQAAPPWPHCDEVCDEKGTHALPLQQPFAHEVASQTHWPAALHSWPVAHAPQAAPPVPHDVFDSDEYGSHALPLQQPLGQDVASHTHVPPLHSWPPAHAEQLAPLFPHEELVSLAIVSQVEPLQQPAQAPPPQ